MCFAASVSWMVGRLTSPRRTGIRGSCGRDRCSAEAAASPPLEVRQNKTRPTNLPDQRLNQIRAIRKSLFIH
jgi:hypothetical protein